MKRKLTALFFETDFDLEEYLKPVIGQKPQHDMAVPAKGKYYQFRNIEVKGQNIYGRLCHIRVVGRPDSSMPNIADETKIPGGVIEASCFRFIKEKKILLMQQNSHVAASESALRGAFIKLLNHINQGGNIPPNGFSIRILVQKHVLRKISENKGGVTKIVFPLAKDDIFDVVKAKKPLLRFFNKDAKKAIKRTALQVSFFLDSVEKEDMIQRIVESKDEEDGVAFHIRGEPPLLMGKYLRKQRVPYEVADDASYVDKYRVIYAKLGEINVSSVY